MLTGAALVVAFFVPGSGFTKIWSYLATMALPFAIDILRVTGLKISKRLELAYLIFIVPAMVMGIDFDVYKIIYPFDKIVHGFSGVLTAFAAREIVDQGTKERQNTWFRVLFSMSFVAFVAVAWECFEFLMDKVTGTSMQELILPGLSDTMYDIVVALIGGMIGTFFAFPAKKK